MSSNAKHAEDSSIAGGGQMKWIFSDDLPTNGHSDRRARERGLLGPLHVTGAPNPDIYEGTAMPGDGPLRRYHSAQARRND